MFQSMQTVSDHEDRRRGLAAMALLAALMSVVSTLAMAAAGPPRDLEYPLKDTPEASVLRGEIVFQGYCSLCHGLNADGRGRAARMYDPKPANLRESMKPDAYKELIVRKGGKAMGRSPFMPPWGEELTNEQVTDVVRYLRTISPPSAPK